MSISENKNHYPSTSIVTDDPKFRNLGHILHICIYIRICVVNIQISSKEYTMLLPRIAQRTFTRYVRANQFITVYHAVHIPKIRRIDSSTLNYTANHVPFVHIREKEVLMKHTRVKTFFLNHLQFVRFVNYTILHHDV